MTNDDKAMRTEPCLKHESRSIWRAAGRRHSATAVRSSSGICYLAFIRHSLLLATVWLFTMGHATAQWPPYASATTPDAQRNALSALRSQINFFQNATRTASSYGPQGYGNVQSQFQALRDAYNALKQTLNPQQSANGGDAIAELDAGLDILQEAFGNFQNDIAAGRSANVALRDMCQVLRQGTQIWSQQLNKTCTQLRIGWG